MPLYFAYGANMDLRAMRARCPASTPRGVARLAGHRVFIMSDGYASVRRAAGCMVHGLLWDLALADVAALDAFEDVAAGTYVKTTRPVLREGGAGQALVYVGTSVEEGSARPGYIDIVVAAGQAAGLPAAYLRGLSQLRRAGTRGAPFDNGAVADRPVGGVRPRFATPRDRV